MMSDKVVSWKKRIVVVMLVAAGGILLFGPAKKFYHRHKEHRSEALAQSFFYKGDYANAALSARQALVLNPTNATACRIMADLADLSQSPVTLDWRRQVAETVPSAENKLKLAESGLRYQGSPFPLAAQILQELAATAATNLALFHVVSAEHALALRRFGDAEKHLAAAAALDPTNRLYQMNLAVIGLVSTNPATLAAARARLQDFGADTNYAAAALRALTTDRLAHDDTAAALDFSAQLLRTPQAALSDRLQHLAILKTLQSGDFSTQLAAVQQLAATNAQSAAQMAMWMQAGGLATNAVQWLSGLPQNLRAQPAVRLALAVALETTGDWPALRQFCTRDKWNEFDFLRLAFLSHAWAQLGETTVARGSWHAAVDAAGGRFGALTGLLELATRWQMAGERQELLWTLLQKFPRERWVSAALEEQCSRAGDTAGLRRIYRQLAASFPDRAEFQNNFAYTSLLLRTNLAEAEMLAARLYAQTPDNPTVASTHAFALHLRGRDAEGLAVMRKLDSGALEQPALALSFAVLLDATGDHTTAQKFFALARGGAGLLPEEKKLLDGH